MHTDTHTHYSEAKNIHPDWELCKTNRGVSQGVARVTYQINRLKIILIKSD